MLLVYLLFGKVLSNKIRWCFVVRSCRHFTNSSKSPTTTTYFLPGPPSRQDGKPTKSLPTLAHEFDSNENATPQQSSFNALCNTTPPLNWFRQRLSSARQR